MMAIKHTIVLVGVIGCVAAARADEDGNSSSNSQTLQEKLIGPYVMLDPTDVISDYIAPNSLCIIRDSNTPLVDVISDCKKQRKGWLKI